MVYAIVRAGGRQEKVSVGDTIVINRVAGEAGDSIDLAPVLLVDGDKVTSAQAELAKVKVTAEKVEDLRGEKIRILHWELKLYFSCLNNVMIDFTNVVDSLPACSVILMLALLN